MRPSPRLFLVLLAPFLLSASCKSIIIDKSASAAEGREPTIQFYGFGSKAKKGYLFIQLNEKSDMNGPVVLLVPKINCERESCVRYQFFRKDGSFGVGGGIPKGQTTALLPLSWIVGHESPLVVQDDGEYSAVIQFYWTGPDRREYSQIMNGFVRLNVLREAYRPVGCDDPAIQWKLKVDDACEAQFTTAGRSVSCGKDCEE